MWTFFFSVEFSVKLLFTITLYYLIVAYCMLRAPIWRPFASKLQLRDAAPCTIVCLSRLLYNVDEQFSSF